MIFLRRVLAAAIFFSGVTWAFAQQQSAGTIVFTHAPDNGPPWPINDVYLMDANGANVRALTSDGHSHDPSWSPDGRRILFIHDAAIHSEPSCSTQGCETHYAVELEVMDSDGGNRHILHYLEPVIHSAAWSPDGTTIALSGVLDGTPELSQTDEKPDRADVFLLPASGLGKPRLILRSAYQPAWSPDGKRLAFTREAPRGRWAVHVADSDGSHDVQLTDSMTSLSGSPAWSPDGKLLAFDQDEQIFVMETDGSHPLRITGTNMKCERPSWSADGTYLVFSCRQLSHCGMVSSIGTKLPECQRRVFSAPLGTSADSQSKPPRELSDHDGVGPAVSWR